MSRIWVTGDAVVDLIPDGDAHYLKCPGGAPANVAVSVSRLGADSAFFGRVGNDPLGRFMRQVLKNESVDVAYMQLDDAQRTSTVIVDLDDQGERSFTFMVKPSADQFLQVTDIPTFAKDEWLHVCSIALANEPSRSSTFVAMERIKAAGGFVSFDPNLREEVWQKPEELRDTVLKAVGMADVVKFSDDEIVFLSQQPDLTSAIAWLRATYRLPMVVITQGKKGALVIRGEQEVLITGKPVSPVDTTGAGDAFVGGLLAGLAANPDWHKQEDISAIIQQANACGALATTAKGAMTALPTKEQLVTYLND